MPGAAAIGRLDKTVGLVQAAHEVRGVIGVDLNRVEIPHLTAADEMERRASIGRLVDRTVSLSAVDPERRGCRSRHSDRASDRTTGDGAVNTLPRAPIVGRFPHAVVAGANVEIAR